MGGCLVLTCPPKQMPRESTSAGSTIWCITTLVAAIETISSLASSSKGQLAGSTMLPYTNISRVSTKLMLSIKDLLAGSHAVGMT